MISESEKLKVKSFLINLIIIFYFLPINFFDDVNISYKGLLCQRLSFVTFVNFLFLSVIFRNEKILKDLNIKISF